MYTPLLIKRFLLKEKLIELFIDVVERVNQGLRAFAKPRWIVGLGGFINGDKNMATKITCEDVVIELKKIKTLVSAKWLAGKLDTDSRAVATALRKATNDGRVYVRYRKGIAEYRFTRMTPNVELRGSALLRSPG